MMRNLLSQLSSASSASTVSLVIPVLLGLAVGCSSTESTTPGQEKDDAGIEDASHADATEHDAGDDTLGNDVDGGETDAPNEVGDDGSDGGSCALSLGNPPTECDLCRSQKCCQTALAAQNDPGTWTNSAAKICTENECADACGLTVPACGGIVPDPASCVTALDAKCCDEVTACGQSDACVAVIYLCIDDQGHAPGSAAFNTCAAQYPGGLAIFDALNDCFETVTCN